MIANTASATSNSIPELDGWRGLAILMVLFSHFVGGIAFGWMGQFGVQLFFVLSGFFMSNLLFIKKIPLRQFFTRRFSRVYPAFFITTMIFYAYSRYQLRPYVVPFDELVATLAFLRTYYPSDVGIWSAGWPIEHYWSLNVEEHSYIYLAIVVLLTYRTKTKILLPAFLAASTLGTMLFMHYYSGLPSPVGSHWSLYSQCAAVGLLASATYRVILDRFFSASLVIGSWVSVGCLLMAVIVSAPFGLLSSPTLAALLLAISVNHVRSAPGWFRLVLSWKILRRFGYWSFSLYLWQQPFFELATAKNIYWPTLAIGCGIISYYIVENPMRHFINSKWAAP